MNENWHAGILASAFGMNDKMCFSFFVKYCPFWDTDAPENVCASKVLVERLAVNYKKLIDLSLSFRFVLQCVFA